MKQKDKTIMAAMTEAYLILILAVLPLYMQDKLTMIGNAKFFFFRNASVAFGAAALVCAVFRRLLKKEKRPFSWSATDSFVLAYGAMALLSFLGSSCREDAFWGYSGWYMGLFSQLVFTGAYFWVSRCFEGEKAVWIPAGAAAAAVMGIGVLNRLDIDVLGTMSSVGSEWNRVHLLSTIGNNNWYAGYISVAAGFGLAAMTACRGLLRALGTVCSFLYFATAMTQGSITGVVAMGAVLLCLALLSLSSRKRLLRAAEAALLLPLANVFLRLVIKTGLVRLVTENDGAAAFFFHSAWYALLAAVLGFYLFLRRREKKGAADLLQNGKIQRAAVAAALAAAGVACMAALAVCLTGEGRIGFDSGRIPLWKAALQCFGGESILRKLIGVGPDCFYQALYVNSGFGEQLVLEGVWEGAVYANAHNEWLNLMICEGIPGLAAYAGAFVTVIRRVWKRLAARPSGIAVLLGTVGYAVCACFTFQQVISTPLLFVLWGMAEAELRRQTESR